MRVMSKKKHTQGGDDVFVITVKGDKSKQQEASEHRIIFPGGYISVVRTIKNDYWAHIGIHKELTGNPNETPGRLINARIDLIDKATNESDLGDLNNPNLQHLAIRIIPAEHYILEEIQTNTNKF